MARTASDWISLAEAEAILHRANLPFRAETVGRWARSGRLQTIKLGGRRFVRRAEIRALLKPARRVRASEVQAGLFEDLSD